MLIQHQAIPSHLGYFLCIEDDLLELSRWIEFCTANNNVYSLELARLLMTVAAESDVVAKALCKRIKPNSRASGINSYQSELVVAYPMLPQATVEMPRFGLSFTPWENWSVQCNSPDWWRGYNHVKHDRAQRFTEASLKNVLNATAALLLLIVMLYSADHTYLIPSPKIFIPRTFATNEVGMLRLYTPDGVDVPWA